MLHSRYKLYNIACTQKVAFLLDKLVFNGKGLGKLSANLFKKTKLRLAQGKQNLRAAYPKG